MKRCVSFLLVVLVLLTVGTFVFSQQTVTTSNSIWTAYQDALVQIFSKKYPHLRGELNDEKDTFTHIVTTPMDALWNKNPSQLANDICRSPPMFSLDYHMRGNTDDDMTPRIFESILKSLPTPQPYLNFKKMSAGGFNWQEFGPEKLSSFISRMRQRTEPIHFTAKGQDTQIQYTQYFWDLISKQPWYQETVDNVGKRFVRVEDQSSKNDDDQDEFLFPTMTASYDIDFRAQGISAIRVAPGQWFDNNVLRQYQSKLKADYLSASGKMPLIQDIIWVVYKPRVSMKVTETAFNDFKKAADGRVAISVGSVYFRPGTDDDDDTSSTDSFTWKKLDDDEDEFHIDLSALLPKKTSSSTYQVTLESRSEIPQIVAITSSFLPK